MDVVLSPTINFCQPVFEIKVLFCAPLGCIYTETVRPEFSLCTPLVYGNYNRVNKCAHIRRTCPKNVRPAAKMCAPGAECTVNFEYCQHIQFHVSFVIQDCS